METSLGRCAARGIEALTRDDPRLFALLTREHERQFGTLSLIASASFSNLSVLACEGTTATNVTTEGYPGRRYHAGSQQADEIEQLAIERAMTAFKARYANVQPHSGSSANQIVLFGLLEPGDVILGMDLDAGGHLTHGASVSVTGRVFRSIGYGVDARGLIDYTSVERLAHEHRPRLIICGGSAYPRRIDFERFRHIADQVGALLLADISHIAGLVAAGLHPSPIDVAHVTTTSTYKQLYGPRGGMILIGKEHDASVLGARTSLAQAVQRAVFPYFQGTPSVAGMAAKARALDWVSQPAFRALAHRIVRTAAALASALERHGYAVLTGGTDNHLVVINVLASGLTGVIAQDALEACNIIVNKNRIPEDTKAAHVTSGMRLGTNRVALRGMNVAEMERSADLIDHVLRSLRVRGERAYDLDPGVQQRVMHDVDDLCCAFPIPHYPR